MDKTEEEKLRDLIRKELENRDQLRADQAGFRKDRREEPEMSEERRRIIDDEICRYFTEKGNHHPFVNEEGDTEWLTADEIENREKQIPVDMEELEEGQTRMRNRVLILFGLGFCAIVFLLLLLREHTGTVQVLCNVSGATIVLNGSPTDFQTDFAIDGIPVGPQLISVSKLGYEHNGPVSVMVNVRAGNHEIVTFTLSPEKKAFP